MKAFVIAGTASGVGKTTVSLGLMAAFRQQGLTVQPFKVGPDFIDPLFHQRVCGRPSRNLDGWLMSPSVLDSCFSRASAGADLCVVEGVMGLFDGYDAESEAGSTAEAAKRLKAPVVLVVDARSMARSAAAVVQGFENFDRELDLAGVIFNRVGSPRHLQWLGHAVRDHCRATCLGGFTTDDDLLIHERHLGLSTAQVGRIDASWIRRLARKVRSELDLSLLLGMAEARGPSLCSSRGPEAPRCNGERVRIGVARDDAFCFYYEDNLELLRELGADLVFFSPLRDPHLPPGLHGLYLGGGYPEVHASALSENQSLLAEVREASEAGLPVYAECGGMIFLCRGVHDLEGAFHRMAGVFPFEAEMLPRRQALGYVTVTLEEENLLGDPGDIIRGHEFHYSRIVKGDEDLLCTTSIQKRQGEARRPEGFMIRNTFGSYVHIHFGACPGVARNLIEKMRRVRMPRQV